jgi:transglutaminase-like putative cysteine protease
MSEMHFLIRFQTRYVYDAEVVDNLNALRVKPAANNRQRVDEFSVRLTPEARLYRHDDYFGTEVVEFEVSRPHRELMIDVRARVTTLGHREPTGTTWDGVRDPSYRDTAGEFLFQTDDAPGNQLLAELASEVGGAPSPLAAVLQVMELIPDRFAYRQGTTYVDSPLTDLLDGGAGVCQDFVHLGLNLLRHHGIAARYVSGYLFTSPPDADEDAEDIESVEVDTHAWLEALLPGEDGESHWAAVDPTNRCLAGARHVKIGHGRHYNDIPPIKGVYRGGANATLEASVHMTRVDGTDPTAAARA